MIKYEQEEEVYNPTPDNPEPDYYHQFSKSITETGLYKEFGVLTRKDKLFLYKLDEFFLNE